MCVIDHWDQSDPSTAANRTIRSDRPGAEIGHPGGMDRRHFLAAGLLGGASAVLAACGSGGDGPTDPPSGTTGSGPTPSGVEVIASGLNVPWAMAFLADGSALVTQRDDATVVRVSPGGEVRVVGDIPDVAPRGEGGLQGIAIRPGDEGTVFAYYTTAADNRLVSMDFDGARLGAPRPLITGLDTAVNHHGGAILPDRSGALFVAVGDAAERDVAQDRQALNGKILRVDGTGKALPDNPFGNEVWSMGHRNVEGMAFDADGRLWATEFGQNERDELNLIRRGGNYGWPVFEGSSDDPRFVAPAVTWPTAEASPAGLAIVGRRAYVAALRGQRLWEVPLDGASAGTPTARFVGEFGRLRAAATAPDGSVWMSTSNTDGRGSPSSDDDRLIRFRPA